MLLKLNRSDVVLSYLSQLLNYGSSILVLPLILSSVSTEELGIWYLFSSFGALIRLLDLGVGQTILRQTSYLVSGSNQFSIEGVKLNRNNERKENSISILYIAARQRYKRLTIYVFVAIVSLSLYVHLKYSDYLFQWCIYGITSLFLFNNSFLVKIVEGKSNYSMTQSALLISKIFFLVLVYFLVQYFGALDALILSYLVSNFIYIVYIRISFFRSNSVDTSQPVDNDLMSVISVHSRRFLLISSSVYLLNNTPLLLGSIFLDLETVGIIGITLKLFDILKNFSKVYFNINMPKISSMAVNVGLHSTFYKFLKLQVVTIGLYLLGFSILSTLGQLILRFFKEDLSLAPPSFIYLYGLHIFLELIYGNSVTYLSSINIVRHHKASVLTAIMVFVISYIGLTMTQSYLIIPMALLLCNTAYNLWKWPILAYRESKHE